jgi:hypothetical protein
MKLTPNANELAVDLEKRQEIEDCAENYLAATGTTRLTQTVNLARADGITAVFDKDAEHANGVFEALTAKTGKPAGVFVTQDILARTLLKLQTGVDPGSPVAVGMTLVPSDPAAFVSASTALEAAIGVFVSLGYEVV